MQPEPDLSARITDSPTPLGLHAIPLFHAAWLFAVGVLATNWVWLRPTWLLLALAFMTVVCGLAAVRALRIAWLPLAVLWCLLGAWCAEMEPRPAPSPAIAALSDGLLRSVEGTVVDVGPVRGEIEPDLNDSDPTQSAVAPGEEPSQRIDLRVSSLEVVNDREDVQSPITGGVRLTVRWPAGESATRSIQRGDRIRAFVRFLPPETYRDPGVWSLQDYLADQGITSTAAVNMDDVERVAGGGPSSPFRFAALACRIHAFQHLSSAHLLALPAAMRALPAPLRLSQADAAMLAAMVTGDRTYLTHSLRVGFERTGSFHMLVVSGFHLAIVASCILWAARRLRIPRVPATLITIAASFAYAFFTGFATPVQRSLWMVGLYLGGRLFIAPEAH